MPTVGSSAGETFNAKSLTGTTAANGRMARWGATGRARFLSILGVAVFASEHAKATCNSWQYFYNSTPGTQNSSDSCSGNGGYYSGLGFGAYLGSNVACDVTNYFFAGNGNYGYYAGEYVLCPNDPGPFWRDSGYVGPIYTQGNFTSGNCLPGTIVYCPSQVWGSATEAASYVYLPSP
jgi:hypothetical protein